MSNDAGTAAPLLRAAPSSVSVAHLRGVGRWAAGVALPFLLVVYLALSGGGYDSVVHGEIGIVAWWVVLLGTAVGALPIDPRRAGPAAWVALGLLAAFTAWTALSLLWTESTERTAFEIGRVATLLGIFTLTLLVQNSRGLRRTVGAVATAIAVIAGVALLARIQPSWFPADTTAEFLPGVANRLDYPLNYWNGLAALMAIGVPLLLTQALVAGRVVSRALAAGAVPVLALVAFLTLSRGGALATLVGVLALLALSPRRLALIPLLTITGAGSAILIAAANQRDAFIDALATPAAASQGDEMLAYTLVVGLAVGLVVAALSLAVGHGLLRGPAIPRKPVAIAGLATALIALIAFLAAGGPSSLSDDFEEFKTPTAESALESSVERFGSATGGNRWQFWSAAADANASSPITGIGPGTYEFWWAANGTEGGFVRDAHSLYLETLAELGVVGLVLLLAALLFPLGVAISLTRRGSLSRRRLAAGAAGAMITFLVAAGIDWAWELAVLPAIFLLLAAATLTSRGSGGARADRRPQRANFGRLLLAAGAVVAIGAIALPVASIKNVRESQQAAASGDLERAMLLARDAESVLPSLATPHLQQALVLEAAGELAPAALAAEVATERDPQNWRTWLTLARIEAERGRAAAAVASFRRARQLNPRSPLFNSPTTAPVEGSS